MRIQRIASFLFASLMALSISAEGFDKAKYYASAQGKKGQALKTALAEIIYRSTASVSYDGLLDAYKTTDVRPDGTIWDMYSNVTKYDPVKGFSSTYKVEGDGFNREHTIPQSIFGGAPMKSDLYHVYPTDAKINGVRSNYCHGEVAGIKTASKNNFCYLGTPTTELKNEGCKETYVFEPNDQYKGDFARTYFYFVTCYERRLSSFEGYGMFSHNAYPSLTNWAKDMLMRWSEQDAVSKKETDRIEAVYAKQPNRNPFIDFPGLEQYIWGDYQNIAFNPENYVSPYGDSGSTGGGNEDEDDDNTGGSTEGGNTEGGNAGGNGGSTEGGNEDTGGCVEPAPWCTYVFTSKSWDCESDSDNTTEWQGNGTSAYGFVQGQGVQVTKSYTGAGATSPRYFDDVVEIDVMYATNSSKGEGSINIKVGDTDFVAQGNITTDGGTSPRELKYFPASGYPSGNVQFTVNCSTNSIYVHSITVKMKTAGDDVQDVMVLRPSQPVIYDLSGRRVNPATMQKGVYVVNGRKILVP